jgi:fatty acid desaturase
MGRGGAAACFYHAPGRTQRPGEEDPNQERRLQELSRGYEGSPWLTLLVNFSGFLAIFAGAWAAIFLAGTAGTHGQWWPYALILAALVGVQACLLAVRYQRRRQATGRARITGQ